MFSLIILNSADLPQEISATISQYYSQLRVAFDANQSVKCLLIFHLLFENNHAVSSFYHLSIIIILSGVKAISGVTRGNPYRAAHKRVATLEAAFCQKNTFSLFFGD